MSRFAIFALCLQACLIQNVFSQCQQGCQQNQFAYQPSLSLGGINSAAFCGSYGGSGTGQVGVAGDVGVAGNTVVVGSVPVLGAVDFCGSVPATGSVSISGRCGCGCSA